LVHARNTPVHGAGWSYVPLVGPIADALRALAARVPEAWTVDDRGERSKSDSKSAELAPHITLVVRLRGGAAAVRALRGVLEATAPFDVVAGALYCSRVERIKRLTWVAGVSFESPEIAALKTACATVARGELECDGAHTACGAAAVYVSAAHGKELAAVVAGVAGCAAGMRMRVSAVHVVPARGAAPIEIALGGAATATAAAAAAGVSGK
jgi:hypothetical protein